ncbi:DNA methyltransferase [Candidatus Mycalebacterium sp.]
MGVEPYTLFTGDNLPIMRGMDDESVDLIYLDPPFNKNKDFKAPIGSEAAGAAFKDWWTLDDIKEEEIGEIAKQNQALSNLIEGIGAVNGDRDKAYLTVMAIRLLEMHRILKLTGSIYLHCDTTMSHSLKLVMDAIFGEQNFRNEIIWSYHRFSRVSKRQFAKMHDVILFYSSSTKKNCFNEQYIERRRDKPYDVRHDRKKVLVYNWEKFNATSDSLRIEGYKIVDSTKNQVKIGSVWDIPILNSQAKERTGYPTQKPLALLERIILASSNEGDIVLDPFCGCATTPIAAMRIARKWIGIDLSEKAVELINIRMKREGLFSNFIHRTDIPRHSNEATDSKDIKTILYGKQRGVCNLCVTHFPYVNLTIDHITPTIQGGANKDYNKQLLCGHCNSVKGGNRTMAQAKARLKEINAEYAKHP